MIRKKLLTSLTAAAAIAVALAAGSGAAFAGTATASMPVTATVETNCLVSTTSMAFPPYAPGNGWHGSTSEVTVNCSSGIPFSVYFSDGTGTGATDAARIMTGPASGDTLTYELYSDSAETILCGSNGGTGTPVTGTGKGFGASNAIIETIYGKLPDSAANQAAPAGAYSDSVTVTVAF